MDPVILEAGNNLLWIAGFEHRENTVRHVFYIGPIFSGKDSLLILRKKLDTYNLSVSLRTRMFRTFEEIPVVPFHICLLYTSTSCRQYDRDNDHVQSRTLQSVRQDQHEI